MSSNTRKKRKKDLREERVEQDGLIFRLPQETLLLIFKYLPTEDLIHISGYVFFLFPHLNLLSSLPEFVHYFVRLRSINNCGKALI